MSTLYYSIILLFPILPLTCQEKSMPDIRDENHKVAKYVAAVIFIILLLYGIISNTVMAIVLFYNKQYSNYSNSFLRVTSQLIIVNLMSLVPHIVITLPEMLQNQNSSYGKSFFIY